MSIEKLLSNIVAGIIGATIIHSLVQMLLWAVSFGPTFIDYLLIWLILLPIPLVLGVVAGILTTIQCRASRNTWAFSLAMLGMIGAMVSVAFGPDDFGVDTWSSLLIPMLSGAISELVIVGFATLGASILKKIRNLIDNK